MRLCIGDRIGGLLSTPDLPPVTLLQPFLFEGSPNPVLNQAFNYMRRARTVRAISASTDMGPYTKEGRDHTKAFRSHTSG
jgi:hypothetical protein